MLDALWQWREGEAARRDVPPFKVVGPAHLVTLAAAPAQRLRDPRALPGLPPRIRNRYGRQLVQAARTGIEAAERGDVPPEQASSRGGPRPAPGSRKLHDQMRAWRKKEAAQRKVPTVVVLPNPAIAWCTEHLPKTEQDLLTCPDIGAKRVARYGAAILALVENAG